MSKDIKGKCPNCGEIIEIDEYYEEGDEIICGDCDSELIIERLRPLKFRIIRKSDVRDSDSYDYDEDHDEDYDYEDAE